MQDTLRHGELLHTAHDGVWQVWLCFQCYRYKANIINEAFSFIRVLLYHLHLGGTRIHMVDLKN